MPPTLRTATISVLTAQFQSLQTLLAGKIAGRTKHYEEVTISNEGDVDIYVSVIDDQSQVASIGDSKKLGPGQQLQFADMDTSFTYVATTDANAVNSVGFFGNPVFGL